MALCGLLLVPATSRAILSGWDIIGLYFVLKFAMYMHDSQHGCACCKGKGKNHTCKIRELQEKLEQLRLANELTLALEKQKIHQGQVVYVE